MGVFKEPPYNKVTQQIIDKINCNYKVFSKSCTVEQVNEIYLKELKRGEREGFFPVLVPSDDTLAKWLNVSDEEKEDIINSAGGNGKELLQEWYNSFMGDYVEENDWEDFKEFLEDMASDDEEALEELKECIEPIDMLSSFSSYRNEGIEETILFQIPVDKPWKVIGWIPMGGWNECPAPKEMITICRYWYEKYGAVPAVITHDVMEFLVEKPVTDKEEAMELAKEHCAYTSDIVEQCTRTGTLGEIAECLLNSKVWYFWWD